MDAGPWTPWPHWHAHVLEHHLALAQLRLGHALQQGALAALQLDQHARRALPGQLEFAPGPLRVASYGALLSVLAHLAPALGPCLARLAPLAAALGSLLYVGRLASYGWLRREWVDFACQLVAAPRAPRLWPALECPICAEEVPSTAWHVAQMPCCERSLCWSCVRRHVESVIDDARPEMLCPLGACGGVLPDRAALTAIRREQWSLRTLDLTGRLARRKARAYERWAVSCGLAASCSARAEDVVHCPRDGCDYMFVLPKEQRREKGAEEPRSAWNPRAWAVGRCAGLYAPPTRDGRDLRRVHCDACEADSCLLCGLLWDAPAGGGGGSHHGKSCLEHAARHSSNHKPNQQWAGAKPCPGCSVRIIRSIGCNHMTCTRCGTQWCWVCLSAWEPRHYSCRTERWGLEDNGCHVQ